MAKCTGTNCPMQVGYDVKNCNHDECPYRTKPMTNADRIRAMSDEELAQNMSDWQWCGDGLDPKDWLEWLKQPAEQKVIKNYKKVVDK